MEEIKYLLADILLFLGFILYFVYNVYTVGKLDVIVQAFLDDQISKKKNLRLINYFFKMKDFFMQIRVIRSLKIFLSEKNSFYYISILSLVACLIYILQLHWLFQADIDKFVFFDSMYMVDAVSVFLKILITSLSFFFFFLCQHESFLWKAYRYEFGSLIFLIIFSMILLVSANDFFLVFIAIEAQTASIIVLIGFQITKRSGEAGLKYFIFSSLFSGLFLYSAAVIYFSIGSTAFETICSLTLSGTLGDKQSDDRFVLICIIMTIFLIFKIGVFPYHYWISDAYEGSSLLVTGFLVIISKIGLFGVLLRVYLNIFINFYQLWGHHIQALAICSMILTAIAALFQNDVRRFLAYSGMSNMSIVLLGFSLVTLDSTAYTLYFFVAYLFANLMLFLLFLGLIYRIKDENGKESEEYYHILTLKDFQGLFKNNKIIAFSSLLILLNLIGVPPTAFFTAKYFVFECFARYNYDLGCYMFLLVNLISAFYYLRIVKIMFFDRSPVKKSFSFISNKISFIFYALVLTTFALVLNTEFLIPYLEVVFLVIKCFY